MSASTSLHETEAVLFMTLVQLVVIILAARGPTPWHVVWANPA